ncbi:MAG: nucleotidyltransferase family protein [Erysipelotrichaceae bacterium]|nr:nucleotidyltransferase family protein [Erysipelotrichaceae bacterium]
MNAIDFVEYVLGNKQKSISDLYSYADDNELIDVVYNIQKNKSKSIDIRLLHKLKKYNSFSIKKHEYIKDFLNQLNEEKIKYCIVKGRTLSYYLYNDDSRFYKDIDIIVAEDDYRKFCEIAVKNGFRNPFLSSKNTFSNDINYYENSNFDDVIFEKNINDLLVAIEVKTHFRSIYSKEMNSYLFNNCIYFSNYKTLPIDLMIVVVIYNCYFSYYTEYGIRHKFQLKQIVELYMLFNKIKKISDIYDIFQRYFDLSVYDKVIDLYYKIFKLRDKITLSLFDDFNLRLNNFYKSKFDNLEIYYPKLLTINKYSFNNNGRFSKKIVRYFKYEKLKVSKINYDFFENDDIIAIFIKIPRVLDDIVIELTFIDEEYKIKKINISKYLKGIIEYNSDSIFINYFFRYYERNTECIFIQTNAGQFANKTLFKIDIRKVLYPHYPFLTDEFSDEYLIISK